MPRDPGALFSSRPVSIIMAAGALAVAAFLRLWGITFSAGSPIARPDEEIFITVALRYFAGPVAFYQIPGGWPDGFFRIVHGLQRLQLFVLEAASQSPVNLGCLYAINPAALGLPPRFLSAVCGILACVWVGLIVRRLAPRDAANEALAAGILALGCNYLVGRDAHFGVSDATLNMTIALATYFCVRAVQDHPAWLLPAGFVSAAGFGVKYAAGPFIIPAALAAGVCVVRPSASRRAAAVWACAGLFCALIGLRTIAPTIAWSPSAIAEGIRAHGERYQAPHPSLDPDAAVLPSSLAFYATSTLPAAFGWFGFGAAIVGLALAVRRDRKAGLILVAGAVAFCLPLIGLGLRYTRYASPIVPFLAAGLGLFLCETGRWLRVGLPGWRGYGLTAAVIAMALLPPAVRLAAFDRLLARTDTRDLAAGWLLSTDPNATFVSSGYFERIHGLEPSAVAACRVGVPSGLWRAVPKLPARSADWRELVDGGAGNWAAVADRAVRGSVSRTSPLGARFGALTQGVLPCGRYAPIEGSIPLEPRCFTLEQVFSPGTPACGSAFDLFDRFWVPFTGFEGQERPGPEIRIYRNTCVPSQ